MEAYPVQKKRRCDENKTPMHLATGYHKLLRDLKGHEQTETEVSGFWGDDSTEIGLSPSWWLRVPAPTDLSLQFVLRQHCLFFAEICCAT